MILKQNRRETLNLAKGAVPVKKRNCIFLETHYWLLEINIDLKYVDNWFIIFER